MISPTNRFFNYPRDIPQPAGLNRIQPNSTRFNQIAANSTICPSIMPDLPSEQR